MDLRLSTKAHPSHRRVPSDEAILRMAAQQRVRNLDPRLLVSSGSAPLPLANKLSAGGTIAPLDASAGKDRGKGGTGNEVAVLSDEEEEEGLEEKLSRESAAEKKREEANAVFGERYDFCLYKTS